MKRLRRFLRLPVTQKRLLLEAVVLLEAIKLGMLVLPFATVRRLLTLAERPTVGGREAAHPAFVVARAVEVSSHHAPGLKTCLAQALAVRVMLVRRGHRAVLRIGVAKVTEGELEAHAWVESGGRIVIGGSEAGGFIPLIDRRAERSAASVNNGTATALGPTATP